MIFPIKRTPKKKKAAEEQAEQPPKIIKKTGSAKARRSAARLTAVQSLYQIDLGGLTPETVLADYREHYMGEELEGERYVTADESLLEAIVRGVMERRSDLDTMITGATGKEIADRMEALLQAILRAGAWEILTQVDTPSGIIINDYVNVGHAFFEGREPALINGILDKLARTLRG